MNQAKTRPPRRASFRSPEIDMSDRYDEIIKRWAQERGLPWMLVKAQVRQESAFDPEAISSCGAIGLMQVMPATGRDMGFSEADLHDPEKNIEAGTRYLKIQYDHFPEIPDRSERLKFSLGAYNGGRGYINRALMLVKNTESGNWREWDIASPFLSSPYCFVINRKKGKKLFPDYEQILDYVDRIWNYYQEYLGGNLA